MKKFLSEKEIFIELGLRLKKIRLNKNLTQKEVAKKTGIDRATISQIENGKPTLLSFFLKLVRLYNKLDEFLDVFYTPEVSPMELYEIMKKKRKRATSERYKNKKT